MSKQAPQEGGNDDGIFEVELAVQGYRAMVECYVHSSYADGLLRYSLGVQLPKTLDQDKMRSPAPKLAPETPICLHAPCLGPRGKLTRLLAEGPSRVIVEVVPEPTVYEPGYSPRRG